MTCDFGRKCPFPIVRSIAARLATVNVKKSVSHIGITVDETIHDGNRRDKDQHGDSHLGSIISCLPSALLSNISGRSILNLYSEMGTHLSDLVSTKVIIQYVERSRVS